MKLWPFTSAAPAAPVITPADAARTLAAIGAEQRARREQKTQQLRNCVASGRIAHLGWKG